MRRFAIPILAVATGWAAVTTTVLAVGSGALGKSIIERVEDLEGQVQRLEAEQARLKTALKQKSAAGKGGKSKKPGKPGQVLRARGIEVLNKHGTVVFKVEADLPGVGGASLKLYNKQGGAGVLVSAGKDGGRIQLLNANGKLKRKIE